jgi:hypothetical protein
MDEDQEPLFNRKDIAPGWSKLWTGMPEYDHRELMPRDFDVVVNFRSPEDRAAFAKLIGQRERITMQTRATWYPQAETFYTENYRYQASGRDANPRYPVYIVSKGRWETRMTARQLDGMNVPYCIVVEPQERASYAAVIDPSKILTLPFSNLGQGSIPARNWIWEHSIEQGAARHWILDDNIQKFFRYHDNKKIPVGDGAIFRACEDFSDRYENVALSGMQYEFFVVRKKGVWPPFVLNTRVYSCILISNDLPYRWRGRYNEDTDLSIRCLKDGWVTVLFNAFLAKKITTMTTRGGNMESLYAADDGRLKMAESLREQHPDIVRVIEKWGRAQHIVDYSPFRDNKLRLRDGVELPAGEDDYGMSLRILGETDA